MIHIHNYLTVQVHMTVQTQILHNMTIHAFTSTSCHWSPQQANPKLSLSPDLHQDDMLQAFLAGRFLHPPDVL